MVTVSIMRLLLIGLTWYLLGATTIQVIARLTRSMAMMRIANALSVPLIRRVVSTTLGMGLAASMVSGATGTAVGPGVGPDATTPDTAATAVVASTQATMQHTNTVLPNMQSTGPNAATMQRADRPASMQHTTPDDDGQSTAAAGPAMARTDAAPAGDRTGSTDDAATMVGPQARVQNINDDTGPTMLRSRGVGARYAAVGADDGREVTWTVQSGDHLWHIATTVMGDHLDRPAADDEVTPYWTRLIEANRDRLPDPDNPDLLLPGLVLIVPHPDTGPA